MDIENRMKHILAQSLDVDPGAIRADSNLVGDLGADSLDSIELVMALEDELGIEVGDSEIDGVKTFGQLVEVIRRKLPDAG